MRTRTNPGASCRSGWSCNATWLVLILLQLCASDAALFAVDLGSEFLKVSLIQPGRVPISIVGNEMSKRKTVADVAIVNGERFMGVEATALRTRHPSLVFYRLRDFLGKPASHPSVAQTLRAGAQTQLQFELVDDPNRGTVRFKTGDNSTISAEELVGSILKYAKGITQAQAGQEVVDCVLTVPSFFGPTQKQAILDAARLADVNVLALVGSHAAAALQYGIERDFINKTENVVFYDMGSNAVQVAYVVFSSYQVKDKGKKKTINQLQVKDVVWNDNLGGDHLDWMLVDHLANEFFEKYGSDPRNTPRALAKLKKSVRQTKEVLSANTEAPIYVEELLDDRDFSSKISRNDFESLAADFFDAAKKPLEDIMIRNNLAVSDLDGVELLGGGTRVPKLQVVLSEVLGGRPLDRHLDADEAAVMGAGLVAANESTMFRLRQFGLVDGVVYPLSMQIDKPTGYKEDDNQDAGDIFKPRSLLPYMKRLPAKRVVHLPNFTADPFKISVFFNTSDGNSLPPGTDAEEYATYEVSGTKAAIDKYSDDFKVSLHFSTDNGGLLALDKVEYVAELQPSANAADVNITVNGTGDKQSQNETELAGDVLAGDSQHNGNESNAENTMSSSNGTETVASEFPESGNENSAPEGEDEAMGNGSTVRKENTTSGETETVKGEASKGGKPAKKKVIRITLHTSGPILVQPGLDKDSFSTSIKVMTAFWQKELEKKAADTAKNELESYILKTQEYLNIDEDIQQVTTEDQRSSFSSQLSDAEDWLYMEGEDEPAAEFRKRLRQLQEIGDKMSHRASELNRRPEAVAMAQEYINLLRKAINSWPEAKPWLDQTEIDKLVNKTDEFEEWLNGKIEEQSAKERHEDPVFRSEEVNYRRMILEKVFKRLSHKKAPKPPPPPPQAQGENETVSVNNTNTTESHGGEENEEHSILGSKKQEEESEAHDEL